MPGFSFRVPLGAVSPFHLPVPALRAASPQLAGAPVLPALPPLGSGSCMAMRPLLLRQRCRPGAGFCLRPALARVCPARIPSG